MIDAGTLYENYRTVATAVIVDLAFAKSDLERQENEFLDYLATRIAAGLYDTLSFDAAPQIAKQIWPSMETAECLEWSVEIIKKVQYAIQERLTVEWAQSRAKFPDFPHS